MPMPEDFDLSQYEMEDAATYTPLNLRGDEPLSFQGQPVVFHLHSPGSKEGQKAMSWANRRAQIRFRGAMQGADPKKQEQEAEDDAIEKLCRFTVRIDNWPLSAKETYANPKLGYIRRQIDRYVSEDANFSRPSATSSESTSGSQPG